MSEQAPRIKVQRPTQYLEIPIETSPQGANGKGEDAPLPEDIPGFLPTAPRPPAPSKDPSGELIQAAQTVFKAITARVAFHEKEAQRLREALAPFQAYARQSVAPTDTGDDAQVKALLLKLADTLNQGDQQ